MKKTMKTIRKMIQLDIDAVHAYEQALVKIDDREIKSQISAFRDDHRRHIDDLSDYLRNHNETVPKMERDLKGFLIEGFTALRSATGTEGALKAMKSNEKITNSQYQDAIDEVELEDARVLLQKNYEDEKRHLAYIEQVLDSKEWQHRRPA
jgi:rubrerythrin